VDENISVIRSRFFHAHAMLTREHATDLDAQPQDIGAKGLGPVELTRLHHVEK